MRILRVENQSDRVQLLRQALKELDAHVHIEVVANGVRAIEHLHLCKSDPVGSPPDLILFDIDMPVMNGLALLRLLQQHAEWRRIPVVILAAIPRDDERAQAMQLGAVGYWEKPSRKDEWMALARRIRRFPHLDHAEAAGTPTADG